MAPIEETPEKRAIGAEERIDDFSPESEVGSEELRKLVPQDAVVLLVFVRNC